MKSTLTSKNSAIFWLLILSAVVGVLVLLAGCTTNRSHTWKIGPFDNHKEKP